MFYKRPELEEEETIEGKECKPYVKQINAMIWEGNNMKKPKVTSDVSFYRYIVLKEFYNYSNNK